MAFRQGLQHRKSSGWKIGAKSALGVADQSLARAAERQTLPSGTAAGLHNPLQLVLDDAQLVADLGDDLVAARSAVAAANPETVPADAFSGGAGVMAALTHHRRT